MKDNRPYKIRPPKDLKEYIIDYCGAWNYLIFDTKKRIAICTHCRTELPLDMPELAGIRHESGRTVGYYCPECGAEVVPKNSRYGRKKLTDYGRITWTKALKGVTFIETDRFIIDYRGWVPTVSIFPDQQIRLSKKSQKRFDFYDGWFSPELSQASRLFFKRRFTYRSVLYMYDF